MRTTDMADMREMPMKLKKSSKGAQTFNILVYLDRLLLLLIYSGCLCICNDRNANEIKKNVRKVKQTVDNL